MRLYTIARGSQGSAGVGMGSDVLDIAAAADAAPGARLLPPSVRGILAAGEDALQLLRRIVDLVQSKRAIADRLREAGALTPADKTRLLAPIPDPGFVLSCGMNYHAHLREMKSATPPTPAHFAKNVAAIVGPGTPIRLPPSNPNMVDWEGEFCAVIGRACHAVREDEALDCVAGYTLVNDVSARDWVAPIAQATGTMGPIMAWEQNILGKQFPTFCPMGPAIVTKDEIPDPHKVAIETRVNGTVMQSANTDDLVFNLRQLIAYYTRFYRLMPGDVITTGSPSGVGYGRDPKVFLRAGDTVSVTGQGIGALTNPVAAS